MRPLELAIGFGVNAAVIGVVVVAFGTTMPELFVGLFSVISGSNIANIGLVLGVAAVVQPFSVNRTVLTRHTPFVILAMALLVGRGFDRTISQVDGIVLLFALGWFMAFPYRESRRGAALPTEEVEITETTSHTTLRNVALILTGVTALYLGSWPLIVGGRNVLRTLGFGSRFIGPTVLALGTSLPEFAASVVSVVRDKGVFSLGNVVGSEFYNIPAAWLITMIVSVSARRTRSGWISRPSPLLCGYPWPTFLREAALAGQRRALTWCLRGLHHRLAVAAESPRTSWLVSHRWSCGSTPMSTSSAPCSKTALTGYGL